MPETKLYGTVLVRAKEIMDFIAQSETNPTLKEISQGIEMTSSTVLKILTTLDILGFVTRTGDGKSYRLGMELFRYGQRVAEDFDIRDVARGPLSKLRDQTSETINLGVIAHHQVTLVEKYESPKVSISSPTLVVACTCIPPPWVKPCLRLWMTVHSPIISNR
ncbi:helix-turn-helix domain-containing protein [Levilactobacillus brevis]|nr:helix-turn-helix domain-containing protein [Levilactobacillus brevis]